MGKKKYKDKCDECKNFGFCKGYKGRIICEKRHKRNKKTINKSESVQK